YGHFDRQNGQCTYTPNASVLLPALVKADLRQFDEGAGAVRQPHSERRQAMFLDAGHFAEGAGVSIRQERGIVTEAGGATRWPDQGSVGARLDFLDMSIGPGDAKRGNEMRLSLRGLRGAALLEQALDP